MIGLLAFLAAALFAGAALYVSVAEHPARMQLDDAAALAQWRPSYARGKLMQAGLALIGSLLAFLAWWESHDWLWLAGGIVLLANWPYTLVAILPVNHRLGVILARDAGPESRALLVRWGRLHAMRSLLGGVAALLMLFALAAAPLLVTRLNADPNQAMDDCCRPAPTAPAADATGVRAPAGLWETAVTPLSTPSSDLNPGGGTPLTDRRRTLRYCFNGREPAVGGHTPDGRCTYTQVADRGTAVRRAARCPGARPGWTGWATIYGQRSAERYDYHVRTSLSDAAGRTTSVTEAIEEGRWLGPCPSDARPADTNSAN